MNVLYITYENVFRTGILQAMAVKPMALIHQKFGVDFCVISTVKDNEADEIYEMNKANTLEKYPYLKIFEFRKRLTESQSVLSYCRDIFPILRVSLKLARKADVIHCRSYGAGLIGLFLKLMTGRKVVFDMRGVLPEETVEVGKLTTNSSKFKLLKMVEKVLIKHCDYVLVVSDKFEEYIKHNFKYKRIINTYNPTDFNEHHTFKTYERINFVYSGSLQPWHLPETTIKYYAELSKYYKYRIHFYFCTNDIEKAKKYFKDCHIEPQYYTIQSVPFEKMKDIYGKAHIGFCFINESFSKFVCFPVKFSEYIASNIYALVNKNIGDLEKIVNEHNCGLVFNNLNDISGNIEKIKKLADDLMENHIVFDRNKMTFLDWNTAGIEKIYDVYRFLCRGQKNISRFQESVTTQPCIIEEKL